MTRKAAYRFRLYVAGDAPNSKRARANLAALCLAYLPGRSQVEVVDVFLDPERALADAVYMTPTLVTVAPDRVRRILGTLSQAEVVLHALGLEAVAA